jgi:hypothetical protein
VDNATLDTPIPETPCTRPDCQRALTEARAQAGFYKAMFQGAKRREAKLQGQLVQAKADADARLQQQQQRTDELQAQVRLLKQRLYGRSCETQPLNTLAHSPDGQPVPGVPGATAPPPRRPREARLRVWHKQEAAFAAADQQLRAQVAEMARVSAAQQTRRDLTPAARAVLESLDTYWPGLTVFVEHPEVPMDNNAAERAERGPVVGRKNYYGSGAVWSGQLAATLFSVFETLRLGGLNARQWLTGYLTACAANGGQPLPELRRWLPWQMTEAERAEWKLPAQAPVSGAEDSS